MSDRAKKKQSDDELHKALKDSFPASDPPPVTRAPADKSDMSAVRIDRKAPKVELPLEKSK